MAWTTPGTATAGEVLTAARWNSDVRDNSLMGQPVFTNEAARDAAITSPAEGQMVYLTAPTVPAASGGNTFVPTGITTIYNGSAWVCTTPVGAFTVNTGTLATASYTATLNGSPGTNPSVTLVTGSSALVHIASQLFHSSNDVYTYVSVAVSGATTAAAADSISIHQATNLLKVACFGSTFIIGGLNAGTNTFTLNYRLSTATGDGSFSQRRITVQGIA